MTAPTVRAALVCAWALVAACHSSSGGGGPPATYTVGGTLSGLSGTGLVLRNNAGNDLSLAAASSSFTFATALTNGSAYSVTVATQPTNPSQTCAVTGGSGTVGTANVSTVQIACTTNGFAVNATVTGLDADGLVLQNNGTDLAVAINGTVTFPGQTLSGAAYAVAVKTQPTISPFPLPAQFCTVTNGSGTVGNGPVTVAIACAAPVYKYLYVSNPGANDVGAYSVNASTGELTPVPGAPFAADVLPFFAVPEPSGKFLYVSNRGDNVNPPRVSAYTVDAATGALTELAASPFEFSVTPQPPGFSFAGGGLVPLVHRSGAFAYASGSTLPSASSRLYGATINSLTGELTEINGFPLDTGFSIGGPAQDSGGRVLFVATDATIGATNGEIRTFLINSPSGTLTPIGVFPAINANLTPVFVTPGDNFVFTMARFAAAAEVFAVEKTGGVPNGVLRPVGTPVPTGPAGSTHQSTAFNRRNHVLYVTNTTGANATPAPSLAAFRMDPSTGVLTAIGTPISTNGASSAAFLHPSGRFLLQYNSSILSFQVFAIDPTTFAPTLQPNVTRPAEVPATLLVDFSGKYLYTSNLSANVFSSHSVSSYRIDTTTGALTLVATVPASSQPGALAPFGFQPQ